MHRTTDPSRPLVRRLATSELAAAEVGALRRLLWAAFDSGEEGERMTEADWEHALGGTHFVLEFEGAIAAHAAVVERRLWICDRPLRTGYVEAVATAPSLQRRGLGSLLMAEVNGHIRERFELGSLGTGVHPFYERLGWRTWRGPTSVRTADGERRTPDEDGYILVLTTPQSGELDLNEPIACEWRPGDVW